MKYLFCLLLFTTTAQAGEVRYADVKYQDGIYKLVLDVDLDADRDTVYAIVTDYQKLHRISDALVETTLLSEDKTGKKRRRLVAKTCILFFCFTAKMTEDVEEINNEIVLTTIVPELSDFSYGKTEWRVTSLGQGRSRIHFDCQQNPDFWIPPVIGPLFMKRKMLSEARQTIERIEHIANNG